MNKKVKTVFLTLIMLLSLSSCGMKSTSGSGQEYLISSLGFDNINGQLTVYLEAIIVNSEDMNAEKNVKLVVGKGDNCQKAFADAEEHTVQAMTLSHCAAAAIGQNITNKQLFDIYEFLYDTDRLSLSMVLVSCKSAQELLSAKPTSSIAMGYDILSYLERLEKHTGTVYLNKLYDISSQREKPNIITPLPYLSINDGEFSLNGLTIYSQDNSILLNKEEALIYSIVTGNQNSGSIILEEKVYKTKNIKAVPYFSSLESNQININLYLNNDKEFENIILSKIQLLYSKANQQKIDVFDLYNQLYYRDRKEWQKSSGKILSYNSKLNIKICS